MHGLQLARKFYDHCRPMLWAALPDIMPQATAGLVGEGSECLGCDDATSQDHDFGPAFCLWMPRAVLHAQAPRISAAFAALPQTFAGLPSRFTVAQPKETPPRIGPLATEDFYRFFLRQEQPPQTWQAWLRIPEYHLRACTNGEIFADGTDGQGTFMRWRAALLAYYPRDVWLKKLATSCMLMAQAGQYNLPRCLLRGDGIAAMLAASRFAEMALAFVFACNRQYTPFYKWGGKLARTLPVLGPALTHTLDALAAHPLRGEQDMDAIQLVEAFCTAAAAHLRAVGLSRMQDNWLWAHGPEILRYVENDALRSMDMLQCTEQI